MASAERTCLFECSSCGHRAKATVHGVGEGSATILNITPGEVAASRAAKDAEIDAYRTMAIAACPKCGAQDRSALRRWWLIHLWPLAVVFIGLTLAGWAPMIFDMNMREEDRWISGWVVTGIAVFCCGFGGLISILPKWASAQARIKWEPIDG